MVLANLAAALSEDGARVGVVSSDLRSTSSIDEIWHSAAVQLPCRWVLHPQHVTIDTERVGVHLIPRGAASDDAKPSIDSTRMSQLLD